MVKEQKTPKTKEQSGRKPDETYFKKFGRTTYEVNRHYIGEISLVDLIKSAISREIDAGKYD